MLLFECLFAAVDRVPPTIQGCPQNINEEVGLGTQFTTVTWVAPTATDDSGQTPTVIASHNPGSTFSVGTTTVTYTFRDQAANSNVCRFEVTVTPGRNVILL